jgi:hypothetical protein
MGWGRGHEDGLKWFKDSWLTLSNPLRIHLIDFPPSWIEPFIGEHPDIVKTMIRDIRFQEDLEIREFLINDWEKFAIVGRTIGDLCKRCNSREIGKIYAVGMILINIFFPSNMRLLNANKAIIKCAIKVILSRL